MSLLERIYHFHTLIQNQRYPNASDLATEFEISTSTAHRDIQYLRDRLLAPLTFDQHKNGYYYLNQDFQLPFEESSKIIFFLGILSSLAKQAGLSELRELQQLQAKIGSFTGSGKKDVSSFIHCEWVEIEPIDEQVFATVLQALQQQVDLSFAYRKKTPQTERRVVSPLKLINYQGRWYLLGWCHLRQARRLFHISRITRLEVTENTISKQIISEETDYLTSAFGIFKGESRYRVSLCFSGWAADVVRSQHWHTGQIMEEMEQGLLLNLPVADDREIIMKILQFGSMVEVLKPQSLRTKLQQEIASMQALYADTQYLK